LPSGAQQNSKGWETLSYGIIPRQSLDNPPDNPLMGKKTNTMLTLLCVLLHCVAVELSSYIHTQFVNSHLSANAQTGANPDTYDTLLSHPFIQCGLFVSIFF